jgi:hypothetical protein
VASSDSLPSEALPSTEPAPRRPSSFSIDRLERAPGYEGDLQSSGEKVPWSDLHLLDLKIAYDACPAFVYRPYTPVLDLGPPEDSPQVKGVKNLAQKEFFRHIRKYMKQQWRTQLRELPNMRYEVYEPRLMQISQVGRDSTPFDHAAIDYYSLRVRQDTFGRGTEAEEEIPVIGWGPMVLLDSGSLHFNAAFLRDVIRGKRSSEDLKVAPETDGGHEPLFSGRLYRVNTRLRVDFNPFRMTKRGDVLDMASSYGAVIEVTWLTDILKKERFATELESQYRRDGEWAFFANFVIHSH